MTYRYEPISKTAGTYRVYRGDELVCYAIQFSEGWIAAYPEGGLVTDKDRDVAVKKFMARKEKRAARDKVYEIYGDDIEVADCWPDVVDD